MVVEVVVVVVLVLFGVGGVSGDGGGWSDSGFDGGISTQMIRLAFDDTLIGQDTALPHPPYQPPPYLSVNLWEIFLLVHC